MVNALKLFHEFREPKNNLKWLESACCVNVVFHEEILQPRRNVCGAFARTLASFDGQHLLDHPERAVVVDHEDELATRLVSDVVQLATLHLVPHS